MAFSIRTRLTVWYVTLLTVSLIAFGMAFSYSLFKIFMYRMDRQISSVANMMVHTVVSPGGRLLVPKDFDIILEKFFGIRTAGNYIQILDQHGTLVAKSSNLEGFSLGISDDAYAKAVAGQTSFEVIRTIGRYPVRSVVKPIILKPKGLVGIIQVATSLEGMEQIFHMLAYIFIPGMVAAVVIASVVGSFLARKALKPVAEITSKARSISAENLDERLDVTVAEDELGRLAATINEMIGRLERSFRQIRQFTADASHELKTPLTILKGEMEIALRSKHDVAHMRDALVSSLEEIDRMSNIVTNLLELAKMDMERGATHSERVDLDKVLTSRFEQLGRKALDRGVEMIILKNRPVRIMGDPVRLGQLFFNLMDNALKYSGPGGRVAVSLDAESDSAVFRVKDTGIGISAKDLPYVFDRFYRVDKARGGEAGGAGLGLSICKEIAESHGGDVSVESEYGEWTLFTVRLPLMEHNKGGADRDA